MSQIARKHAPTFTNWCGQQIEEKDPCRVLVAFEIAAVPPGLRCRFDEWANKETHNPRAATELWFASYSFVSRNPPGQATSNHKDSSRYGLYIIAITSIVSAIRYRDVRWARVSTRPKIKVAAIGCLRDISIASRIQTRGEQCN